MWHTADGLGWWMLWGTVMMVFFWGGLIALVVWIVHSVGGGRGPSRVDPVEIARERYARGEITREQFEEIRRTLGGS